MSLSTALVPQRRQSCNRKSVDLFVRFLELRYGYANSIQHRSIHRINRIIVEQRTQTSVRCVGPTGRRTRLPSSFLQNVSPATEDYRIYSQSVDLDTFFGEEQNCDKVSDVCLLNDHFMLVKMPNELPNAPTASELPSKIAAKLPRCFKCNRGSRISPIREDLEAEEHGTPLGNTWLSKDGATEEIFDSRTRIVTPKVEGRTNLPKPVIVEQPQLQPDTALGLQLDTLKSAAPLAVADERSRGGVYWFLWPFRRRAASRPNAPLAAVHKTYFVRWNKPPETRYGGYGVERSDARDAKKLRRCRSAIF